MNDRKVAGINKNLSVIDEMDRKLIIMLQKNGRASYEELARECKTSVSTARRRVERLIRDGIIDVQVIPHPRMVGYHVGAVIMMNAKLGQIDEICAAISAYNNINWIVVVFGRFDILCHGNFRSNTHLKEFLKQVIAPIDGIIHVETLLGNETVKLKFAWLPEKDGLQTQL